MLVLGIGLGHLSHAPGWPCPLWLMTGLPCPTCGMTTAVRNALTGHLRASLAANPFGLVAVGVALALLARPRWRYVEGPVSLLVVGLAVVSLAGSWAFELHRFAWI